MSDYDFWEEQEQAEREYDAQKEEIADAYERGYEKGKADAIDEIKPMLKELEGSIYWYSRVCQKLEQLKEKKND